MPFSPPGEICFNRQDGGLPWPLTRGTDRHQLIGHGPHCFEAAVGFEKNPPLNSVDNMHQGHCLELLRNAKNFIEQNNYQVPRIICQDFDLQGELSWNAYVYFNYNYFKFEEGLFGEERFRAVSKYIANRSETQDDYFGLFNGQNFGDILVKHWQTPDALTPAELEYIHQWHSPMAIRLASLGLICSGLADKIGEVLERSKEVSQLKYLEFPNGIPANKTSDVESLLKKSSWISIEQGELKLDFRIQEGLDFLKNSAGKGESIQVIYSGGVISADCVCNRGDKCCCPPRWKCCNSAGRCCCQG